MYGRLSRIGRSLETHGGGYAVSDPGMYSSMTTSSGVVPGRKVDRGPLSIWVVFLIAGCASPGATMQPTKLPGHAVLVNYGSVMRPRCEDADMKIVDG